MKRHWWYAPLYLWALPTFIFGALFAKLYYKATDWRWFDGCLEVTSGRLIDMEKGFTTTATTLSYLIIYGRGQRQDQKVRVHEHVHVVQVLLLGTFWWIAYGVHFLVRWAKTRNVLDAYSGVCFEKQAYAVEKKWSESEKPTGAWGEKTPT